MIKDTNPDHYKVNGANFIKYMNNPKISGFGNWMFANGYNSGVWASSNWNSVNDRLPENAKHPGDFCPRYLVYTDYGITEGWYNPDKECWYGFLTFMTTEFEVWNIDLERGDIPMRIKNIPVKYWMAMPNPPKEDEN